MIDTDDADDDGESCGSADRVIFPFAKGKDFSRPKDLRSYIHNLIDMRASADDSGPQRLVLL